MAVALGTKQIHTAGGGGGGGGGEQIVGGAGGAGGAGEVSGERVGSGGRRRRARSVVQRGPERVGLRQPRPAGGEGVLAGLGEECVGGEWVAALEWVLPERIWWTTQSSPPRLCIASLTTPRTPCHTYCIVIGVRPGT